MDFPIYVVGDGYVFYNVFNSIAMVFNNASFWNSVFLLGGLSMLVGVLFKAVQTTGGQGSAGSFGITTPLYFAAIVALIGIRSNVIIQDIYSGQVYKVSNVPIVVSAPASMFTTAGYKVFNFMDTVWTLPGATTSLSVGSNGFLNPIKMLLVLRSGIRQGVDPYADKTLEEYVTYCGEADTLDSKQVSTVSQVALLQYLQTNAFQGGITNVYNSANPLGLAGTCRQAADYLVSYFQSQIGDPNTSAYMASILNLRMKEKNPTDVTGKGAWVGLNGAGSILNIGGVAAQSAQTFALNALTFNTITLAFNCRNQRVFEAAMANCVTNLALADTMETWKTSETFSATFFTNMAMGTQTFMQLLFFAYSPMILIYMLFVGSAGFELYFKYLKFGIWTASFLPLMAVIQGITMFGLQARAQSSMGSAGLTLETWGPMYHALSDWLTYGSAMMAAAPGLAWGLLTAGGAAMVSVISRLNGDGHADPSKVSPEAVKHSPMVVGAAGAKYDYGSEIGRHSTAADIKVATSNQVSQVDSQALQNSISQSWGKNWQAGRTETDSAGTKFTSTTDGIEYTKTNGQSAKLTKEQSARISAEAGVGTPSFSPAKLSAAFQTTTGRAMSSEDQAAFNMSQKIGWSTGAEAGHSTSLTGSLSESEQRAIASQMTTATQKARTQTSTVSQTYDINALKGIRDANPKAYDTKINNQAMDMARGPDGLAFDKAMQQATQDLNGYQMDPASKDALIKTVALANTQKGGVDISGLTKPDVSGVNQSRPNINPGTSLSSGAQAGAKTKVEAGAVDLKNQSGQDRAKLEPASGAMAAGVIADGVTNVAGAATNAVVQPVQAVVDGARRVSGAGPIPEQNRIAPVKSDHSTPAPGAQMNPPVDMSNREPSTLPSLTGEVAQNNKNHKLLDATKMPNERGGAPSANAGHNTQASPAPSSGAQPAQAGTKPTEKK